MAFLAKLFGKKKNNAPAEEVFTEEEGLTPEEEAAAEAAEAALLNGEEISETEMPAETEVEETAEETPVEEIVEETPMEEPVVEETAEETPVEETVEEIPVEEPVTEEPAETPAEEEIEETATKKSFWGRLKSGLTKTRNAIFAPVDNLLKAFTKVDEDLLEELEEILISADVGFTACEALISTALSVSILQPSGAWITIVLSCFIQIHTSGFLVWIAPTMTESDWLNWR